MTFNSWHFAGFFLVFYALYLSTKKHLAQNLLLLLASYYFYAVWDWRFCFLMLATTLIDFCCGVGMGAAERPGVRRLLLLTSVGSNLTVLGFFKYYNFFLGSLDPLLAPFGLTTQSLHLQIVLPVGVSFYTFQAIAYTVDVYRRVSPPTRNLLDFAVFVAFFPQLVAGPIERARNILPQIAAPRTTDAARLGSACWLFAWGLWKKVVLADNLAALVDPLFARSDALTASEAYLAVVGFAFQIYCDFSAYTDMARATARLMGFELSVNFDRPYVATSPSDFWRRWHISLSSWLRDYLYIPLGGNRGSAWATRRNLMVTMFLGGLWHGASWNYVWWGVYHGLILCLWPKAPRDAAPASAALGAERPQTPGALGAERPQTPGALGAERPQTPGWRRLPAAAWMFQFTLFGWLLFRCNRSVILPDGRPRDDSFAQIVEMLTSFRHGLGLDAAAWSLLAGILACAAPLLALEALAARQGKAAGEFDGWPRPAQIGLASALLFTALFWAVAHAEPFIYFQF